MGRCGTGVIVAGKRNGLDHRAYRRAKAALRRESRVCWICGQPIDTSLTQEDGRGMDWTADHVTPRSKGGHLLGELRAAHRACNAARGNRADTMADRMPTSRKW
ncbi:HNH endonuclease [Nocardia panacis]|uniref:HNH endonuclease n=1 Tax=Nocardia panacis TaxID=2340916 RepID=A0A3A4K3A2_9NOCA|nr:HNH endonuclease [Nocardia panacis]